MHEGYNSKCVEQELYLYLKNIKQISKILKHSFTPRTQFTFTIRTWNTPQCKHITNPSDTLFENTYGFLMRDYISYSNRKRGTLFEHFPFERCETRNAFSSFVKENGEISLPEIVSYMGILRCYNDKTVYLSGKRNVVYFLLR